MTRLVGIFMFLSLVALSVLYTTDVVAQSSTDKIVPHITKPRHEPRGSNALPDSAAKIQLKAREQLYFQQGSVAKDQLAQLLYKTPSYYPCGYVYTAELIPLSGDPDLFLHEKVPNVPWRKIKFSELGGSSIDSFTFTCSDITPSATNVDLDVKGYTAASYSFYLYREASSTGFKLKFPLSGYTKTTAPVTAIVDHNTDWNSILTYAGETGTYASGCLAYMNGGNVACDPSSAANKAAPWAYKKVGGGSYNVSAFNYIDDAPGTNVYMWYDNHRGYDYSVPEGTSVLAAEGGQVTSFISGIGQIEITHPNGYKTYYAHMKNISASVGQSINKGAQIGEVFSQGADGAIHLHFVVKDGGGAVLDPYGRTGLYLPMWE